MAQAHKNPLDQIVDYAANKMVASVNQLPDDSPPFASRKLSEAEQMQRYLEMRDKPEAWIELMDDRGLREAVQYAIKMEHLLATQEGEDAPVSANGSTAVL